MRICWRTVVVAVGAALLCRVQAPAGAAPAGQGTTVDEFAQLQLPAPAEVKVALVPFWDYNNLTRHVEVCRHHLQRYFTREGFAVVPPGLVTAVVNQDAKLEPGVPMRRNDAVRLATKLGANWAVYGNVLQLETYEKRVSSPNARKHKSASGWP